MESQFSHQIKVGLFVSAGLLAVMISILALGGDRSLFKSYVRIYARLPQVQGLSKGSIVSLAGVTVGNVDKIEFGTDNLLSVAMRIEGDKLDRIPADSNVEVRTQGALGDKFIYIVQGNMNGEKIKPEGKLEPMKSADLLDIISQRGGEVEKVFDIITELKKLMIAINADGKVEKMVTNMSEASVNLKYMSEDARKMVADMKTDSPQKMKDILARLDSILVKIDRGEGTLGALVNDSSLHEGIKALVGASPRKKYMQSVIRNTLEKSDEK